MLRIIDEERGIKRCQQQLVRHFKPVSTGRLPVKLGHAGGSFPARVAWSESLGLWFYSRKLPGERYWNAFGIGLPEGSSALPITCEINIPLAGIDRKLGGAFVRDRNGRTFVVHRGLIGGAKKGVGKSLFAARYRGAWSFVEDGPSVTPVALVGELSSPRFVRQLALFVHKIDRLKNSAVSSPQLEMTFAAATFREEWIGRALSEQDTPSFPSCNHGLIVQDLAAAIHSLGYPLGNDGHRDLFLTDGEDRITAVFQVVSDPSESAVFDGVARLLVYGTDLREGHRRIIVLPEGVSKELTQRLERLPIDILSYAWHEARAVFPGLAGLTGY